MVFRLIVSVIVLMCFSGLQTFAQPPQHGGHHHRPPAPNYRHPVYYSVYRYVPPPPPRGYYNSYSRFLLRDLTDSIIWSATYNSYYRTSYPDTEYTKHYWVDGVRYTCRSCSMVTTLNCNLESNMKCCECIEQVLGR